MRRESPANEAATELYESSAATHGEGAPTVLYGQGTTAPPGELLPHSDVAAEHEDLMASDPVGQMVAWLVFASGIGAVAIACTLAVLLVILAVA